MRSRGSQRARRVNLLHLLFLFSTTVAVGFCFDLPLTPAPVPDCSELQLDSVHFMLQPTLAHVVCAYAAFHTEMSRGDAPLRAVVFSPGKHQLGNRVLELSSVMLLAMCTDRALYVQWDSPSHILRHAQPVLFDWRVSALADPLSESLQRMTTVTKESLIEDLESDKPVLHYSLELGDHLLKLFSNSLCAPVIYRLVSDITVRLHHASQPSLIPALPVLIAPWLPALLRPSDAALASVSRIWRAADSNSQDPVHVVLLQLRQGGHTHSYKLLNETGEAVLFSCALDMARLLDVPCQRLAYFVAADKQIGRQRAAARLSQQHCSKVLHSEGPIVRSGDDLNREADEGGYSPVQVDDEGLPRTMQGIDLAWEDWWAAAYARHAVLTDRSSRTHQTL